MQGQVLRYVLIMNRAKSPCGPSRVMAQQWLVHGSKRANTITCICPPVACLLGTFSWLLMACMTWPHPNVLSTAMLIFRGQNWIANLVFHWKWVLGFVINIYIDVYFLRLSITFCLVLQSIHTRWSIHVLRIVFSCSVQDHFTKSVYIYIYLFLRLNRENGKWRSCKCSCYKV